MTYKAPPRKNGDTASSNRFLTRDVSLLTWRNGAGALARSAGGKRARVCPAPHVGEAAATPGSERVCSGDMLVECVLMTVDQACRVRYVSKYFRYIHACNIYEYATCTCTCQHVTKHCLSVQ